MRTQLERTRKQLVEQATEHPAMKAAIDLLLAEYDDALQPPLRTQINFIHKAQRLIKICVTKTYEHKELLKKVLAAPDPSWTQMKQLPVDQELKQNLAQQLFHSSGALPTEKIIIATTQEGHEVTEELIVLCLQNDVDFELGIKDPLRMTYLINELSEEALQELTKLTLKKYEGVRREIIVSSATDPEIKKQLDEDKMKRYKEMNKEIHDRAMSGELHYTLTRIPTAHGAELEEMGYEEYLELFFELCDQPWKEIQEAQEKLIELFDEAKELKITNSDGTDVTLDITGMTFANSVTAKNIPGSEIFSAPLREGTNGQIVAKGNFYYGSSGKMRDISLQFEKGRLMDFSATEGQEALEKIVAADDEHGEGTRHLGEIGIGTNPHLRQHVTNSLLVEKIGGSFHVALGSCYTYQEYLGTPVKLNNGNVSHSSTHWDLTTMLRGRDGKMFIDGALIQDNGEWVGAQFRVLNEGWGALHFDDQPAWWKKRFPEGYGSA